MDKATRGLRLYQGQGALYERLLDEVETKSGAMVADGDVTVRLAPFGLVYAGKPVSADDKRVPYLFRMFCDGIRELTVTRGVTRAELATLVALFGADKRESDEDMVIRLWKADLPHVRHYAVDSFNAGATESVESEADMSLLGAAGRMEQGTEGVQTTLSSDDVRILRGQDGFRWIADASAPPAVKNADVTSLQAEFHAPPDFRRFVGIGLRAADRERTEKGSVVASPLVLGLFDGVVAAGEAEVVAGMLTVLAEAESAGEVGRALFSAIVHPDRMRRLVSVFIARPAGFLPFFETVASRARDGLVALLTDVPAGEAQVGLQKVLLGQGIDLTTFYAARIADPDEHVVLDAVAALGNVGTPDALRALGQALRSDRAAVRGGALKALAGRYVVEARMEIGRALRDPALENRMLALAIVRSSGDPRMGWMILTSVEDMNFGSKSAEEQAAVYEALASFKDNRTLGHFSTVLGDKNLLRSKAVVARQLMAVRALGTVGTPEALEILNKSKGSWFLAAEVKAAAESASRGKA